MRVDVRRVWSGCLSGIAVCCVVGWAGAGAGFAQVVGGQVVGLPQAPTRDTPPVRTGTGVIGGVVTAADTRLPMRRAVVTLMTGGMGGPANRRTVTADLVGRFEFTGVPAGNHTLRADPGPFRGDYVGASFGGAVGEVVGRLVVLADGQRIEDAHIALPRGGAIEGRVVDEFGEPVARVNVYAARAMGGGSSFARMGSGAPTDDQGRFRLYGLLPAEYIVAAESQRGMGMPVTEGETEGFAITYYPSTLVDREATRVRIALGGEAANLQIQLVRSRTFRITGTVFDSQGRRVARPSPMLVRSTPGGVSTGGGSSFNMSQEGEFTFRDVLPGEYRLYIRPAMGGPFGPPPTGNPPPREYATVTLHVYADIDDLVVATAPGVSVTGRIVFAEGAPVPPPSGLRVSTQPADRMAMTGPSSPATVDADMQFTLNELFAPLLVRMPSVPPRYALEAVRVGSTDITDEPFEFKAAHSGQLEIVLTSRVGGLEGEVTDDDGAPARGGVVVVIPDEKTLWKSSSSRMRMAGVRDGRFSLAGLLPGRYHVVAVQGYSPGPSPGVEFYEALVKVATAVVVAEGESRTVELRVVQELGR